MSLTAQRMDREIHSHYTLFPCNYVAADLLSGKANYATHYTEQDKARFEHYLDSRLALIDLPNKDEAFLRERMLIMYANPLKNHEAAQ